MIPDDVVQLTLDYVMHEVSRNERYRTLAAAALVSRSWLTHAQAALYAEPLLCVETPRKHAFHTEKLVRTFESRFELLELVRSLALHAKRSDMDLLGRILALLPRMHALTALSLFVHYQEADLVAPYLKELPALRHLAVGCTITVRLAQEILAIGDLRWLHLSTSIGKHNIAPKFVLRHLTADWELRPATLFNLIKPAIASSTLTSLMLAASHNLAPPDLSSLVSLKALSFVYRGAAAEEGDKDDGTWLSVRDTQEYDGVHYMLETLESARLLPSLYSIAFLVSTRSKNKTWMDARYCSRAFFEELPSTLRQLDLVGAPGTFNLQKLCRFLEAGSRNLPDFRLLKLSPSLRASRLIGDDFEQRLYRRGVEIVWQALKDPVPTGGNHAVLYA